MIYIGNYKNTIIGRKKVYVYTFNKSLSDIKYNCTEQYLNHKAFTGVTKVLLPLWELYQLIWII